MKAFVTICMWAYSALALADASLHVLNPSIPYFTSEHILASYKEKTGRDFPYQLGDFNTRFGKKFIASHADCYHYDPVSGTSDWVSGCRVRTILHEGKPFLLKFDLPIEENLPPLDTTLKSRRLSVIETQLFAISSLKGQPVKGRVRFKRTTFYRNRRSHLFEAKDRESTIQIFVDLFTGVILGREIKSNIHPVEAELYPVYEEAFVFNKETEELTLRKTSPVKTKLEFLSKESPGANFELVTIKGEYESGLDDPSMAGKPGAWNYEELSSQLEWNERSTVLNDKTQLLDGKYVSVLVHPSAQKYLPSKGKVYHPAPHDEWIQRAGKDIWKISDSVYYSAIDPSRTYFRPQRDSEHNVERMVKVPTDALHVYHGTTQFFETMKALGYTDFKDSDLKVLAYLYNTDRFYKDNAFYINGTINFTTYSPEAPNFARDNTTIWHELGHSLFDKLVGARGSRRKGHGLNEGMSDFLSHLIFTAKGFKDTYPAYKENRFYSHMKFNFANQTHDDGEAFGGTLKDILNARLETDPDGVRPMADLVLDTLRLMRGTLNQTEQEFFETMLIADSLDSDVRKAGDFRPLIEKALESRNFSWKTSEQASVSLTVNGEPMTFNGAGTRNNPFVLEESAGRDEYRIGFRINKGKAFSPPASYRVKLRIPKAPYDHISFESPVRSIELAASNTAEFTTSFDLKCRRYNETDSSCLSAVSVNAYDPSDDGWPFAKVRVFFRINKKAK